MDYESIEVKHLNSPSCYLGYIYICICIFICISHLTGYSEQPLLRFDENTLTEPQDSEWRCNPSVTGQEPGKGLQISDLQSKVLASGRMQLSSPDVSKVTSYFQFWRFLSCCDLTRRSSESKVINKTHVNPGRKEIRWSAKLPFFRGPQADHHFSVAHGSSGWYLIQLSLSLCCCCFCLFVKESLGIGYFIYFFLAVSKACELSVPQQVIEPAPPASEALSLNQCSTREDPSTSSFRIGASRLWGRTELDKTEVT